MPRTGLKSEWKRGPETLLFCCTNSTGSKQRLEKIKFASKKSCKTLPVTLGLSYQPIASDGTRIGLRTGLKRALEQTSFGLWGKMNSNLPFLPKAQNSTVSEPVSGLSGVLFEFRLKQWVGIWVSELLVKFYNFFWNKSDLLWASIWSR